MRELFLTVRAGLIPDDQPGTHGGYGIDSAIPISSAAVTCSAMPPNR